MNINQETKGDSAIDAWISPDAQFSYIEFRNKEEAENSLVLSKVSIGGNKLRVSKAKAYAKYALDPALVKDDHSKSLIMSAKSNILFKDIDAKKGFSYDFNILFKVKGCLQFPHLAL